jgi:hypothetical protein
MDLKPEKKEEKCKCEVECIYNESGKTFQEIMEDLLKHELAK